MQTGGRKEARFSSTQVRTRTGRSMPPGSSAAPSGVLRPSEGRGSAQPPIGRLVNQHPVGQRAGQPPRHRVAVVGTPAVAPVHLWSKSPHPTTSQVPARHRWPAARTSGVARHTARGLELRQAKGTDPSTILVLCPQTFRLGPKEML